MGIANKVVKKEKKVKRKLWQWDVAERPICYSLYDNSYDEVCGIDSHKAIIRTDNYDTLGVVGNSFHSIYNSSLEDVVNLVEKEKLATYHSHGDFCKGKIVWAQLESPEMPSISISKKDKIKSYILITNGHAGEMSFRVLSTTVRIICMNTFQYALKYGDNWFTARHTKNIGLKLNDLEKMIVDLGEVTNGIYKNFQTMAETKFTKDKKDWFNNIMSYETAPRLTKNQDGEKFMIDRYSTRASNNVETLMGCLALEPDISDTNWGMFNAVTHYVDHSSTGRNDSYALLGSGNNLKLKAYSSLA